MRRRLSIDKEPLAHGVNVTLRSASELFGSFAGVVRSKNLPSIEVALSKSCAMESRSWTRTVRA